MSRVPEELGDEVTQKAKDAGLSVSDYIALVLAEKHDYTLPTHYYRRSDGTVQEEISMIAS